MLQCYSAWIYHWIENKDFILAVHQDFERDLNASGGPPHTHLILFHQSQGLLRRMVLGFVISHRDFYVGWSWDLFKFAICEKPHGLVFSLTTHLLRSLYTSQFLVSTTIASTSVSSYLLKLELLRMSLK